MARRKRLALLAVAAFSVAVVFSVSFILVSSGHSCCDDDCPVCLRIEKCINLLNTVCIGSAGIIISAFLTVLFVGIAVLCTSEIFRHTLVNLKIKLTC